MSGPAGPVAAPALPPRVLLIDDDPLVRRWVQAALEGLDLRLACCADVAQARAEMAAEPAALVLCDLMLPGTPGIDWLAELLADAALRRGARLAAFSAGVDAPLRARLRAMGVWRILNKPLPLADLLACVADALAGAAAADRAPGPGVSVPRAAGDADAGEAAAIRRHFGGDAALFEDYRACCVAQFPADVAAGDAAQAAGDLPALRRLGHGLKTVARMLGLPACAAQAEALDGAAARADAAGALQAWQALRVSLVELGGGGDLARGGPDGPAGTAGAGGPGSTGAAG